MSQEPSDESRIEREVIATSLSKGSTFLYFGRILFYIIGFIGFAIVARLILREYGNAEPLGWLYVASVIPSLVSILSDFGVGYGIMNNLSHIRIKVKKKKLTNFFGLAQFTAFYLILSMP